MLLTFSFVSHHFCAGVLDQPHAGAISAADVPPAGRCVRRLAEEGQLVITLMIINDIIL